MIVIISPSKTQTITNKQPPINSQPTLLDKTNVIMSLLKSLDQDQLAELMKTSPKLTEQTVRQIDTFSTPHIKEKSGAALTTFQGDAFSSITTDTYNEDDFTFADSHIRILSGLYGILRPIDLIQPYRLEMGTRLTTGKGKTLYDFWGETITNQLNMDMAPMKDKSLINCASLEYAKVIKQNKLNCDMTTISFKQKKKGVTKTFAIYAKRARGMFVDYIIKNRITEPDSLTTFNKDGYCFASELSSTSQFVYIKNLD